MTKQKIKEVLDKNDINYESDMTKKELEVLLPTDIEKEEVVNTSSSFDIRIKRKINIFIKKDMVEGTRNTRQIYNVGDIITDVHPNHKEMVLKWSDYMEIV